MAYSNGIKYEYVQRNITTPYTYKLTFEPSTNASITVMCASLNPGGGYSPVDFNISDPDEPYDETLQGIRCVYDKDAYTVTLSAVGSGTYKLSYIRYVPKDVVPYAFNTDKSKSLFMDDWVIVDEFGLGGEFDTFSVGAKDTGRVYFCLPNSLKHMGFVFSITVDRIRGANSSKSLPLIPIEINATDVTFYNPTDATVTVDSFQMTFYYCIA